MEGVGARLGRSSTRYGPATVFTGPVRKWKKKWVHVTPPSSNSNHNNNHHHRQSAAANGSNASHLSLYKWTPITASQNKENGNGINNGEKNGDAENDNKEDGVAVEEPRKRKFKYIPVAVLEEQKREASEQLEDEANPIETDTNTVEPTFKNDVFDEKPDINDVPMEDSQDAENNKVERQDLNESLDLSLGLKAHDGNNNSDPKPDRTRDAQNSGAT